MTHPKNTTRTISEETQIELMAQSIRNIESGVKEIKTTLKQVYTLKKKLMKAIHGIEIKEVRKVRRSR